MKITIETIPHEKHRYPTVGDYWWEPNGDLQVRVSDVGDWKAEALVALHELVEVLLTKDRHIAEPDIMEFDKEFEANRPAGNEDEPGDSPNAPYRKEHVFAECLERLFATQLGVSWNDYGDKLNAVYLPK